MTTAVDPATAAHEARHAAAGMLLGLDVREVRADNPSPDAGGHVLLDPSCYLRPREDAVMSLAGRWGNPGWPPETPSKAGPTVDERYLADAIESLGGGKRSYELLVADVEHLVGTPEFKSLAGTLELLLAGGCVLRKPQLDQIHRHACGHTQLQHKTVDAASRVTTDRGEFSALAATWSVDSQREQIRRGAFRRTIERWAASDRRIPLHWNHSPDPKDIIGSVDPRSLRETREGLFVRGNIDLENSEVAREAWRSMKANAVALSFGFMVTDSFKRSDGIRELREIDLFEVSITPAPANSDTRILSTKSADPPEQQEEQAPELPVFDPEQDAMRARARDQMLTLLRGDRLSDPGAVIEREERSQARELRRRCDELRLELAVGHDPFEEQVA
jgi:uncharacterized protein